MVNYFAVMSVHLLCIVVHVGGRIAGFATFASIPKEVVPPWATFGVVSHRESDLCTYPPESTVCMSVPFAC